MNYLLPILSVAVGFITFNITSTPGSKFNRRVPTLKIKNVQLLPSVKITLKGKIIHLHHWLQFSILLFISVVITNGFLDSPIVRGFLVGGMAQGLKFPDRKIVQKIEK